MQDLATTPDRASPRTPRLRHDVLVILAIEGDLRFISHRDTARLLERALMRSGLPVAYSEGFNPHMKLSLLLPRPVGMATCGDLAVVGLTQARTAEDIEAQLRPQMPTDARIVQALPLEVGHRLRLTSVCHELELEPCLAANLPQAIKRFLESDTFIIERRDEHGHRKNPVDARPFVEDLRFQNNTLMLITRFTDNRTVATKDLLRALDIPWDQVRHKIRRKNITWQ